MTKKTLIIMNFIFASIFVVCITMAAIYSAKYGLMWWYILPTFTSLFCCLVVCASDGNKGG